MKEQVKMSRDLKLEEFKIDNPFGVKKMAHLSSPRDPMTSEEEHKINLQ